MNLAAIKDSIFRLCLCWQARPARIARYLRSLGMKPRRTAPATDLRQVRAAALQVKVELVTNPFEYAAEMHRHVDRAAKEGAQLVAFPEDNGIPLLGLLPGMMEKSMKPMQEALAELGENVKAADIFAYLTPVTERVVMGTFSTLAAGYGIYIMAGSFVIKNEGRVVNRSYLFGPGGRLVGTQDKVHLLPLEEEWGLAGGDRLPVFNTSLGNVAIPVCMDATYFETFRILERKGAEIVVISSADPRDYNYWLALRGIWPRVQEALVYGIKSCLVGKIFGYTLTGKAGVFAPLELTPGRDGVLAEVDCFDREGIAVADLDLESLKQLKKNHHWWGDFNYELYRKYFPGVYNINFRK